MATSRPAYSAGEHGAVPAAALCHLSIMCCMCAACLQANFGKPALLPPFSPSRGHLFHWRYGSGAAPGGLCDAH